MKYKSPPPNRERKEYCPHCDEFAMAKDYLDWLKSDEYKKLPKKKIL